MTILKSDGSSLNHLVLFGEYVALIKYIIIKQTELM